MDADDPRVPAPPARARLHGVREPLGLDDRGREIISFLPGTAATDPLPAFAWSKATLIAVADMERLQRRRVAAALVKRDGREAKDRRASEEGF